MFQFIDFQSVIAFRLHSTALQIDLKSHYLGFTSQEPLKNADFLFLYTPHRARAMATAKLPFAKYQEGHLSRQPAVSCNAHPFHHCGTCFEIALANLNLESIVKEMVGAL
jgi:hypothetical protein